MKPQRLCRKRPECMKLAAARAAAHPLALAVVCGNTSLSFGELQERSSLLAHYLRGAGVRPESVVGLCLPPGAQMLTALLAVWKAGAAYLPLDPGSPAQRLAFMLSDCKVTAVAGALESLQDLPSQACPADRAR